MSDFQPGDVVVCVNLLPRGGVQDRYASNLQRLSVGRHYRVVSAGFCPSGAQSVVLSGVRSDARNGQWWAGRFRKIDADTTEEFREQMRSLGKVRERTDA